MINLSKAFRDERLICILLFHNVIALISFERSVILYFSVICIELLPDKSAAGHFSQKQKQSVPRLGLRSAKLNVFYLSLQYNSPC